MEDRQTPSHPRTPPLDSEDEASKWHPYRKRAQDAATHWRPIHKSQVHKSIWVEEWHAESPTKLEGWTAFFEANQQCARDEVHIHGNPVREKDEALRLAIWLKPIKWALFHGEGVTDFRGKMLHGWMGSQTFYHLATHQTKGKPGDLDKALSIVQYPPVAQSPDGSPQQSMVPAVQVLRLAGQHVHYFVRGHPQLRPKEASLQGNGEFRADATWRGKRAWDPSS